MLTGKPGARTDHERPGSWFVLCWKPQFRGGHGMKTTFDRWAVAALVAACTSAAAAPLQ